MKGRCIMKRINFKPLILIIAAVAIIMSCFMVSVFADDANKTDAMIEINASEKLSGAFVKKMTLADDGYIGIPVELSFYYDYANHGKANPIGYLNPDGDAVVLYVVNSNLERIGTKSDVDIISGLLDRGWVVAVADYKNNSKADTPDLDWSAQRIRDRLYKGEFFSDTTDKIGKGTYVTNFILPAGYDVDPFRLFWELDKHGADGSIEKIVENWNTDFRSSQNRDDLVYWCDENGNRKATWNAPDGSAPQWLNASGNADANGKYIRVKYTKAESIGDCVNPDGSPLDLNLYAHVIYPTNPEGKVPVMNLASCGLFLSSAKTSEDEYCDFTGFLFNGYAGMIYDYLWYPMARQYGYYDGNSANGAVTGDHMNYSLHLWNDKLLNTAAMRFIRHLAVDEADTYKLDTDHMGVIGLSKGSWFDFLGEAELRNYTVDIPEDYTADELRELINDRVAAYTPKRYFDGHHGETRYQAGNTETYTDGKYVIDGGELQPWLLYETTGEEILAFTSYNYTACGTNQEDITAGHVPSFQSHAMNDSFGNAYSTVGPLLKALDIPSVDFVCDIYHAMAYGPDEHYGIDTYRAQFAFANYFLKNTPISVMYVDPVPNSVGLKINEDITVAFAGIATADAVNAITLTDSFGNAVSGEWTSSRGGVVWTFSHDPLLGGERYTLTVPASFVGNNGKAMGEDYTVEFETVNENYSDVESHGNYAIVTVPNDIKSGVKLGFYVADDAYNTADVYLVSAVGETAGQPVGSVNVSGAGWYELDVTDVAKDSGGEQLIFFIKAKRALGDAHSYSGMDYSYGGRASHTATTFDGESVIEVAIGSNAGYTVPGYEAKTHIFYSNQSTAVTNSKILGTSKLTEADLGRKFTVTVRFYDTVSRTVMLSLNDTNNKQYQTIDLNSQRYNFMTEAGKWNELSFDYIVYEPTFGDTVGSQVKTLTVAVSPTGDTKMPIYFAETTVNEYLTDIEVSDAYLSVYDDGYAYKEDSSEGTFLVDGTYYSDFASALAAAGTDKTVTLARNCTVSSLSDAFAVGSAAEVVIDLNGYAVYGEGSSPVNIAAKNANTLNVTIKNGYIYLERGALVGYAETTGAAAGKTVNINLENVRISNSENSRISGFMTESALPTDVKMNVHFTLDECDIIVDAYSNINVNFEIFGAGTNNLFIDYDVNGGTVTADSFARAYLTGETNKVAYGEGTDGEVTKLILSVGTPAPIKRLGAYTDVYGEFKLSETDGLRAVYEIVTTEGSTKYGVIPDAYLDADAYPFAVFDNKGNFKNAYPYLFGQENGPFSRAKSLNSQNNVWDETKETYGARPYASYILMRRDYSIDDTEYDWNFAQSQGTTTLDLAGFTLTKMAGSSAKAKMVFPGTAKANTGSGDAYTYPSNFVIENGKIVTNVPLLSVNLYGTTYDLTKKVMGFTFNNLEIVAADGATSTRFLHQIDYAPTGAKGPAIFNIEYNDCIFDLRGYTSPASDTRIFNANTTEDTMVNMQLKVNGGKILANDFNNIILQKLDSYWGSSILFDKGEDGNYTKIELADTATVTPSGTVNTPEGGKVYSKKSSTDGIDTYLLSGKITEYGAVPDEYTDGETYPFLVFADGDFKGAYAYWADKDSTVNSALERAYELANGASGVGVKVTILVQSDYANSRTSDNDSVTLKFGKFTGELTVDLGGNTLTSGTWMLFSLNGQLVDGKLYDTKITLKNGTLHTGNKVIAAIEQYNNAWTEASHGRKLIDVTFKNITFAQSPNYAVEKVPFLENTSTSQTSPIDFKALFEDCEFSYNNHASGTSFTFFNFSVASGVCADITVKGGSLETTTFNNFNFYKGSTGDSLKFAKSADGEYMTASLPEDGAITTAGFISDDGQTLNYAHAETADGRKIYKLVSLVTPYGTIPAANASLVDYPFAVFKDGSFIGAYKYFADSNDAEVNSAIEKAKSTQHGAGGAGKSATILMRRDFVNLEEYGTNASSKTVGKYNNFSQFGGTLNIDLGGNTLTSGTWMLFCLQAKKTDGAIFDTTINIKNGSLHTGNKVLIAVESTSTDYSSLGTKVFKVTFEDVTFADSPDYSGEKGSIILNNTTNANPVKLDVKFKNCVFDYQTHASGTKVNFLDFKKNGGVSLNAEFIGGEFKISTFNNFNIATLDADDTLIFSPNDDGKYVIANVANSGAITTADYKTNDGKTYNFGLMNDTASVDTYVLMDLNTPYGKIDYRYANGEVYPFIIFDKDGFRYAEKIFYGAQAGASAIGRARSILVTSNAWDAENNTYGDGANYAIVLLRSNYTLASTEYFNNLAQMQGTATIDLNGYTLTAADDKYMFEPTIKRWPAADSGDAAEVFPTTVIIKNGTLVSVNKSLIAFSTASSTTVNLYEKRFTWQFDSVTFKNTGSAANPFLACFYKTGLVHIPTPIIYNDCTFDLSNATSAKSVFNIDPGFDVQLQITVSGGKIIAPANIAHLDVLRKVDTNGSTVIFTEGSDGYIKIVTSSEYTNTEALPTDIGNMKFAKAGTEDGKNVYSLIPAATPDITPKFSITMHQDFIYNVYVPVTSGMVRIVLDGVEYTDFASLEVVTLDGTDFYRLTRAAAAKAAADDFVLEVYINVDGETARGRWTLGLIKYAGVLLDGGDITAEEETLIKDILSYVGAAYTYFACPNASEINAKIDALIGADYSENNAPLLNGSTAAPSEGLSAVTYVLDSAPTVRFYLADGSDAEDYTFFSDGKLLEKKVSADGKYIDLVTYAYALGKTITYNIDGVYAGSYHISAYHSYVKNTLTDEALTALVERLAKYLESAEAYRAAITATPECEHEFDGGECVKCGEADPDYVPEDFGTMSISLPTEIYSNYPAKDITVSFSKPDYNGAVTYTTDNANVFVENGKIYATGNFASAVTVTVTAVTEHHSASATVNVSTFMGDISAETKVQYYEANIIKEENKGGMIFVGDSYFDGYKMESIPFWKDFYKDFADEKAFLMGLSSSQIHQLEIVSERIVYPMEPSEIVVHIGHNDMHHGSLTVEQFVARLKALFEEYHKNLPDAKIYYIAVDPKKAAADEGSNRYESSFVKAPAVNAAMAEFAEANDWVEFVDTTYIFYGAGESINKHMYPTNDGSHPTLQAYDLIRVALNQARGKTDDIIEINNLDAALGGNEAGKTFTDAQGNAPTGDFAISGKLVIKDFVKSNAHIQFRFAQGGTNDCRFVLWDADSDGKFGAGYIAGGKSSSDNSTGIEPYDANTENLILPWAVIVKDGVAYWYLNGKLAQTIASPVRNYFIIGGIGVNATVYDIEFTVKSENESAYNEHIAPYCSDDKVIIQNSGAFYSTDINSSGKYITDASGNALTDNYVVTGKLDINEINKNNGHVQFRFASGYRFLLWDSNSDGKLGAGYTEGGKNTNDTATGITLYDANFGITLNWAVVVKDGKAHWFINGKHEKTFETPTLQSFNLGALQADVLFYDIEVYTKAEDEAAFNRVAAKYDENAVNIEKLGQGGDITASGKTFTDASGNPLTNNYIVRGTLDISAVSLNNAHLQFRFGSGCRFLLWDSNSDGVFGAGYSYNGDKKDTHSDVKKYDANNGLVLDWAIVMNEGVAYWYLDGELVQQFDNPKQDLFNIGALQMNVVFYDIELYVKSEGADAYNTVLAEYLA